MLKDLIKAGWWAGKPEEWEKEGTFEPMTKEQGEFFKYNKWVNLTDSKGDVYRLTRGYWSYEQWLEDVEGRSELHLEFRKPRYEYCKCCGKKV